MEIDITAGEGRAAIVITARGELDVLTAASLRTAISEVIDGGRAHLVLDASGITFLDSTGIGVLVIALRRTRAFDGSFAVAGAHGGALRTLELTGLTRVFSLYDTVADAEAALRPRAGEPRVTVVLPAPPGARREGPASGSADGDPAVLDMPPLVEAHVVEQPPVV